jgi:hypothetical protein
MKNLATLMAAATAEGLEIRVGKSGRSRVTRDRCYDFLNIFAEKFSKKISIFDSKQS